MLLRRLTAVKTTNWIFNSFKTSNPAPSIHPVHNFPSYFPKIDSNIILPSTLISSLHVLGPKFCTHFFLSQACYIPCPSHLSQFGHPNNIRWSVQVMKFLILQSFPASRHLLPLRSKFYPQHLFSDSLNMFSSQNVRDEVFTLTQNNR